MPMVLQDGTANTQEGPAGLSQLHMLDFMGSRGGLTVHQFIHAMHTCVCTRTHPHTHAHMLVLPLGGAQLYRLRAQMGAMI